MLAAKEPRSPAERDLVRRLDIFLMTFGCISQIIKYLDQMNINNAYVSGMKEDLELYGNELNYFQTYFNVAYCIMLIPSQVIMTYVRPSLWLSSLEIAWGVMTGLMAMVTKTYQVYIIRYVRLGQIMNGLAYKGKQGVPWIVRIQRMARHDDSFDALVRLLEERLGF